MVGLVVSNMRRLALAAGVAAAACAANAQDARIAAAAPAPAAAETASLWLQADRATALLTALRDADTHGLPVSRYAPDHLEALVGKAMDPASRARAEAALTDAYLRYARDVHSGILTPRRLSRDIKVTPPRPAPAGLLNAAAATPDMAAHLAALAPADPGYDALRAAFAEQRALVAAQDAPPTVPRGPTLRLGDYGPRVATMRARLAGLHNSTALNDAADPQLFDAALDVAVRQFQAVSGLNVDGLAGPATVTALNAGPAQRIAQIAVNLERMRWRNVAQPARRIYVNLADARVQLHDGGRVLFDERVVIGRRDRQTPEFSDEMEHLVLNPTWHVPRSIATRDLLPKLQADPLFLQSSNMRLTRTDGGPLPVEPHTHDYTLYTADDFPYRIKQSPSASNALGLVKFMFPNADNIYLHDTPDKHLLSRDRRAFSSGCVRVQDPMRLAALLLAPQMDDPQASIDRILRRGTERYVILDTHVPVTLDYRTAWVDASGMLQLREDIYGRDRLVADALRAEGAPL